MRVYSYRIEHDYGFAPNPFHGSCTLACCKPVIRKIAELGALVIGTGATSSGLDQHMVYWMQVDEITDFASYWNDKRFRAKRPDMRAPGKLNRFGDNIYRRNEEGGPLIQTFSFHSNADGTCQEANHTRDTGRTQRVLIGRKFAYFGVAAPEVPEDLRDLIKIGPSHKSRFDPTRVEAFRAWAMGLPQRGYVNKPTHWASLK